MAAQQGLLPKNIQNVTLASNTAFAKGMYTTTVSLDPMTNPAVRLVLYNNVYD